MGAGPSTTVYRVVVSCPNKKHQSHELGCALHSGQSSWLLPKTPGSSCRGGSGFAISWGWSGTQRMEENKDENERECPCQKPDEFQANFERNFGSSSPELFELHSLTLFFVPFMFSFEPREGHVSS